MWRPFRAEVYTKGPNGPSHYRRNPVTAFRLNNGERVVKPCFIVWDIGQNWVIVRDKEDAKLESPYFIFPLPDCEITGDDVADSCKLRIRTSLTEISIEMPGPNACKRCYSFLQIGKDEESYYCFLERSKVNTAFPANKELMTRPLKKISASFRTEIYTKGPNGPPRSNMNRVTAFTLNNGERVVKPCFIVWDILQNWVIVRDKGDIMLESPHFIFPLPDCEITEDEADSCKLRICTSLTEISIEMTSPNHCKSFCSFLQVGKDKDSYYKFIENDELIRFLCKTCVEKI